MPVAIFLSPYRHVGKINTIRPKVPGRWLVAQDYMAMVLSDGGKMVWEECRGDWAVTLVRANTAATLDTIAADPQIRRFPKALMDSSLSDLTTAQKNTLKNWMNDAGYTNAEIQARFGNDLGQYTMRDVLRFFLSMRFQTTLAADGETIQFNGPQETPAPPEILEVQI